MYPVSTYVLIECLQTFLSTSITFMSDIKYVEFICCLDIAVCDSLTQYIFVYEPNKKHLFTL